MVEVASVTSWVPEAATLPIPLSITTLVAFGMFQLSVVEPPTVTEALAETKEHVGGGFETETCAAQCAVPVPPTLSAVPE
jgi:hypothetical protein